MLRRLRDRKSRHLPNLNDVPKILGMPHSEVMRRRWWILVRFREEDGQPQCPFCDGWYVRHPRTDQGGEDKYWCKPCHRFFSSKTRTHLHGSKFQLSAWCSWCHYFSGERCPWPITVRDCTRIARLTYPPTVLDAMKLINDVWRRRDPDWTGGPGNWRHIPAEPEEIAAELCRIVRPDRRRGGVAN